MHRLGIRRGVHRDGANAKLHAGALNPQSDLATIGDQYFLEQAGYSNTTSTSPYSTGAPE